MNTILLSQDPSTAQKRHTRLLLSRHRGAVVVDVIAVVKSVGDPVRVAVG
jgi:hypothetical protein